METKLQREGLGKAIFNSVRNSGAKKLTENVVMLVDHTVPGEHYEITVRKSTNYPK